jgi:hypothetical protein
MSPELEYNLTRVAAGQKTFHDVSHGVNPGLNLSELADNRTYLEEHVPIDCYAVCHEHLFDVPGHFGEGTCWATVVIPSATNICSMCRDILVL